MPPRTVTPRTFVVRVTGALLVTVAVLQLVMPVTGATPLPWWGVLPVAVGLLALAWWTRGRLVGPAPSRLRSPLAGGGVAAAVTWCHVVATGYPAGWDAGVVWDTAERAVAGLPLTGGQVVYLSRYPLNLPLVAVLRPLVALQHATGLPASVLVATVAALVSGLGTTLVGSLLAEPAGALRHGSSRAGLLAQGVVLALVGLSPWMAVVYSDLLLLPIPAALLWCLVRAHRAGSDRTHLAWAASGGLLAGLGISLKATLVVVVAAVTLAVVLDGARPWRRWLAPLLALALVLPITTTATPLWRAGSGVATQVHQDHAFPVERWLWIGLSATTAGDGHVVRGVYDRRVDEALDGRPTAESRHISRQHVAQRLRELGPAGLVWWGWQKTRWNLADGTFFAYGEGDDRIAASEAARRAPAWQAPARWWSAPSGGGYPAYACLVQGLWIVTLLLTGLGCLRLRREAVGTLTVAAAATVLGIVAFTAVMEARPRYVFAFVPVVVLLTGLTQRDATREDVHR